MLHIKTGTERKHTCREKYSILKEIQIYMEKGTHKQSKSNTNKEIHDIKRNTHIQKKETYLGPKQQILNPYRSVKNVCPSLFSYLWQQKSYFPGWMAYVTEFQTME